MTTTTPRLIHEIAREIWLLWPSVHYSANPYLTAMYSLYTINDAYGHESARSIITYFLSNAKTWKGEHARRLKKELNDLL